MTMKLEDFVTVEVKENIAVCTLDHQHEKMNVVSPGVIGIFETLGNQLIEDDQIHAVIFISGKKDFMAGADIKSFQDQYISLGIEAVSKWAAERGVPVSAIKNNPNIQGKLIDQLESITKNS